MSLLSRLLQAVFCLLLAWSTAAVAAVTYQAAGTAVNGSTGVGASPAWPAHAANDIALLFVESAGEEPVTLGVANGFAAVANSPQSTGTGTTGTRLTVFWARATSSSMTAPSISAPSNHFYARIVTFRGVLNSGNPIDVTAGGTKGSASTGATLPGVTTTVANTLIVQAVARHNDSAATAFSLQSNANLTGITEHVDAGTTAGHGGGLGVWSGVMATAGATGSTTATVTSSINAFLTIALKPQPGPRFQAAGTAVGGTGAVSPAWPAHAIDDIALLFVESTGGQAATLSVAAGFAAVANSPQAVGAGTAGTRLTVFWARATSAAMSAPTVADPGNHVYAQILTYRGVANVGDPWDITGGGTKPSASTVGNVPGVTTSLASTLIVQVISRDTDSNTVAFSSQVNVNLEGLGERIDAGTTSGNGGGFAVWDGYKATAGATGTTTATVSDSINAYMTIALKPTITTAPVFGAAGTALAAGLNWPAHAVGDVALLFVETAGGQDPTLADPAGFTAVSGSPQATGAGTAGTRLSVYWARATSTTMGGPTISGLTDHVYARILTYRGVAGTGNPWDVTGGSVKPAASISVSVGSITTTLPNTRVVQAVARDNDSGAAAFSAQTNANLSGIAERHDAGVATGLGGGFAVWDGAMALAGATGVTTATVTSSINAFLSIALRAAATQPDHYELSLPAGTLACETNAVTVTACADTSNPCTNASTTLAGQTANLSATACTLGAPTVNFNASGVATTTLDCSGVADGAPLSVTLSGESMPTSPVANARKCCQGGTCSVTDTCSATNKTAGFLFSTSAGGAEAALATQQAGVSSATYYLRAIKKATASSACEAALTGASSVNLAYECLDPATCSASNLMSVNGGAATTIARNNSGSVASYTAVSLSFDVNGNAPFTLNFGDVGRTRLHAAKAAGGSLLTPLAGTSLAFVTAPFDFSVLPSGPYQAGISFGARVTARASGGATTPNFGLESAPETVVLKSVTTAAASATNSQLVGPATGQTGTLTAGSFTLGKCSPTANGTVCETDLAWTEVGDLTLAAAVANAAGYLASGNVPWGSAAAGPFTPAYLTTEFFAGQPCGSFTYSGQPFRIKVSAMSAANTVLGTSAALTQNYTGSYAKAVTLGKDDAGSCVPTVTGFSNNSLAAADFAATPGYAQTATETNVAAPLPIRYDQSPAAPAAIAVCARDADGINSHGRAQAALAIRNGRLRLENAYGSELLPLRVPVRAEYYNGTRWLANTADSCTSVPIAAVALSGGISANTSASAVTLSGGTGTLTLAKPSPTATGYVDLALNLGATGTAQDDSCNSSNPATTAANLPWLQFDQWCTVASDPKRDPNARVKFGSPKAPYIYLRERY